MKTLLISLFLFSFSVQAEQIYSDKECQDMHQAITLDFESSNVASKEMMSYYADMCVSNDKTDTAHMTMVEAVLSNEIVSAIKAKLAEQDLVSL